MFLLPTFNAVLQPCAVGPAAFRAHAQGQFCDSCQRVVQDFSQSENPVADLAAARAAAPDGRMCGRFRAAQVQQTPPSLTRRLKWFLVALVLVVGQGLTAREALAQVRRAVPHKAAAPRRRHAPVRQPKPALETVPTEAFIQGGIEPMLEEEPLTQLDSTAVYSFVEQMPTLRGGDLMAVRTYLQQHLRWPPATGMIEVEGRVFISFVVGRNGVVREVRIVKGLDPLLDTEALRVVRELPAFAPGRQNGQPVAVQITVPVTFKLK